MRVTSFYPARTFKLVLEFDKAEYRVLDMKKFLENDEGMLAEIRDDLDMFMTAELDEAAGTVCWKNGVDFDPGVLYENSVIDAELNYA